MTDRYAVMGHPIAHSKSPFIHTEFARQTGQDMAYDAILVDLDGFDAAVARFAQQGGLGLNITLPFKQQAWELAVHRSPRAAQAGAVNTLWFDDQGEAVGDNTDGVGLVNDLVGNHGACIAGKDVLVLGAGGAARGVAGPLLAQRPGNLVIANRTVERAERLAASLEVTAGSVVGCGFDVIGDQRFDIVVNATSASIGGEVPPVPVSALGADTICYDMMYAADPTPFLEWAMCGGCQRTFDGLGMLVEQAAESFWLWRGVRPETEPVLGILRREMSR